MRRISTILAATTAVLLTAVSAAGSWNNDLQRELRSRDLENRNSLNDLTQQMRQRDLETRSSLNNLTQQTRWRNMEMRNSLNDLRQQIRQRNLEMRSSLNDPTQQTRFRNLEMRNPLNDMTRQIQQRNMEMRSSLNDFTQQMKMQNMQNRWMKDFSHANSLNNLQLREISTFNSPATLRQNFAAPALDTSFRHDSIRQQLRDRNLSINTHMSELDNRYSNMANSMPGTITNYNSMPLTELSPEPFSMPYGDAIDFGKTHGDFYNEMGKPWSYSRTWDKLSSTYSYTTDSIATIVDIKNARTSNDPYHAWRLIGRGVNYVSKPFTGGVGLPADKFVEVGYHLRRATIDMRNRTDISRHTGPGQNQVTMLNNELSFPSRYDSQHYLHASIDSKYNDGFTSISRTTDLQIVRRERYSDTLIHADPISTSITTYKTSRTISTSGNWNALENQTNPLATANWSHSNKFQTYQPPSIQTYEPLNIQTYEPPRMQTYEPLRIQTYEPPRIQTYEPMRIQTYQPPRIQTYEPMRIQTYQPPRIQMYEPPRIQTYQPPRIQTYQPPRIQTYQPPKIQTYRPPPTYHDDHWR